MDCKGDHSRQKLLTENINNALLRIMQLRSRPDDVGPHKL
jgi:hypothetical protein